MEVRNCRACGRLFNYISGGNFLCQACMEELEEKFQVAKKYIKDNKSATIHEVAEIAEVSTKQVEKWVREERLVFAEGCVTGINCENCGVMIRTGRFCEACKNSMANNLSDLYREEKKIKPVKKDTKENPKMRFLNK